MPKGIAYSNTILFTWSLTIPPIIAIPRLPIDNPSKFSSCHPYFSRVHLEFSRDSLLDCPSTLENVEIKSPG